MKKVVALLFASLFIKITFAQPVSIKADPGNGAGASIINISNGTQFKVSSKLIELKEFDLQYSSLAPSHKLIVDCAGTTLLSPNPNVYADKTKSVTYKFKDNIINSEITITEDDGNGKTTPIVKFKFIQDPVAPVAPVVPVPGILNVLPPFTDLINTIQSNYKSTPMGFIDPNSTDDIIHIFLDQYGNNVLGTIPQGISNKQYEIHILYPVNSQKPDDIDYSVKQKTGTFSSALLFNNTGILNTVTAKNNLNGNEQKNYDRWQEKTFILSTATDDITFDVIASTLGTDDKPVNGVLQSYTIKMSPVYHGTFDVGLINSNLSNPTFSLVQSPNNANDMVIKQTNKAPTGIVTIMATLYTSPIILLEKAFSKRTKKHIPNYKLSGRNFLDDHKFFERIYPTVGVSISDKSFQNLFFGLNWEIARGLSLFGGGHWGKVNTFEMLGYTAGVTPVTQAQFDYYSNTKWKVDWAYGVKLDILIITNLFK